jgi:hypothetical protein
MNWLMRLFTPKPTPPAVDMAEDVLTDLIEFWPKIPLYDPEGIESWFQNIGYWLAQVKEDDAFQHWCLRFAMAIRLKHHGLPLEVCVFVVQQRVGAAMVKETV